MAGADGRTGKVIGTAQHVRQSIARILTTPTGVRVMRGEFGNGGLTEDGRIRPGLGENEVVTFARIALMTYEPRATFGPVALHKGEDGAAIGYRVTYTLKDGTASEEVAVLLDGGDGEPADGQGAV